MRYIEVLEKCLGKKAKLDLLPMQPGDVAKNELVEALGPDDVAILNLDDPLVQAMADRTAARVVTTGWDPGADVRPRT